MSSRPPVVCDTSGKSEENSVTFENGGQTLRWRCNCAMRRGAEVAVMPRFGILASKRNNRCPPKTNKQTNKNCLAGKGEGKGREEIK